MGRLLYKNIKIGSNICGKTTIPFSFQKSLAKECGGLWSRFVTRGPMRFGNHCLFVKTYMSVKIMKALDMMVGPNNHARWKHKWEWQNHECVWDKLASEWAGAEDGTGKKRKCTSKIEMTDFFIFAVQTNIWKARES